MSTEHTQDTGPDTAQTRPRTVYLVGTQHRAREYCRRHGVSVHSPHIRVASAMHHLRGVWLDGYTDIVFLADWHTLADGYEMHAHTAYLRALANGDL